MAGTGRFSNPVGEAESASAIKTVRQKTPLVWVAALNSQNYSRFVLFIVKPYQFLIIDHLLKKTWELRTVLKKKSEMIGFYPYHLIYESFASKIIGVSEIIAVEWWNPKKKYDGSSTPNPLIHMQKNSYIIWWAIYGYLWDNSKAANCW